MWPAVCVLPVRACARRGGPLAAPRVGPAMGIGADEHVEDMQVADFTLVGEDSVRGGEGSSGQGTVPDVPTG